MPRTASRSGTRRSSIISRRQRSRGLLGIAEAFLDSPRLRRYTIRGVLLVAVLWSGAMLVASGAMTRAETSATSAFYRISAAHGFAVHDVLIEGRKNADRDVLLGLIHTGRGDPIFAFDPAKAQAALERDPWIASARVERRLPNIIFIQIAERQPFALWQDKGRVALIDHDGNVITTSRKRMAQFSTLPLVVGKGADKEAGSFLTLLRAEPTVESRVVAAVYVGDRRWDLHLKNGITARLPDGDKALALSRLADAEAKDKILDRIDVRTIDLREDNRMIVRVRTDVDAKGGGGSADAERGGSQGAGKAI